MIYRYLRQQPGETYPLDEPRSTTGPCWAFWSVVVGYVAIVAVLIAVSP